MVSFETKNTVYKMFTISRALSPPVNLAICNAKNGQQSEGHFLIRTTILKRLVHLEIGFLQQKK